MNKILNKTKKVVRQCLTLETYENTLVGVFKFFIRRSPVILWFYAAVFLCWINGKDPFSFSLFRKQAKNKNLTFKTRHPYFSAAVSFFLILALLSGSFWLVFLLKPKPAAAWWNDSWQYRKALVIDQAQVAGDLTDFPVLVSMTDATFTSKIQTDGDDIVFTNNLGNKLSHEIESYDSGSGALVAWVKIPALDGDNNSTIYMYYGNASVGSQQDAGNVWDANYVAVYHLGDGTSTAAGFYRDSSRYGNHGTLSDSSGSGQMSGKIGNSIMLDGAGDHITIADNASLDLSSNFTITGWGRPHNAEHSSYLFGKGPGNDDKYSWMIWSGTYNCMLDNWDESPTGMSNFSQNTWSFMGWRKSGGNSRHWINSTEGEELNTAPSTLTTNDSSLTLGYADTGTIFPWDGEIDELRISNIARAPEWITTEYNNQNDPASFFSIQAEEKGTGPAASWAFDEGYGGTAHDGAPGGHDGTITGATWQNEDMCVSGKCLYFDGSGDKVDVGDVNL